MSTKRIISVILTICLLLSGFSEFETETVLAATPTPPTIPTTGDIWDGSITEPKNLINKDGIYYYEITKCSELAYVAQTGGDWLNYNYILANNLILNDTIIEWDEDGNCSNAQALKKWVPITDFVGKFDGNNFTISGLYGNSGIFNKVDDSVISNLTVVNAYIIGDDDRTGGIVDIGWGYTDISNCIFDGYVSENDCCVGGIMGYGSYLSQVNNCYNYGTIKGDRLSAGICGSVADISNCVNYGTIIGNRWMGGVAGSADDIYNCINYGTVTGTSYVGGIGGELYDVEKCTNYGDVFGTEYVSGIGSIEDGATLSDGFVKCSNFGNITATGNYAAGITPLSWVYISECANFSTIIGNDYCGGITGKSGVFIGVGTRSYSSINNSYNIGNVVGNSYCGGIAGLIDDADISYCYNSGNVFGNSFVGGVAVNKQQLMFGPSSVSETYYLKNDSVNSQIYGCEDVTEDILNITAKSEDELKQIRFSSTVWKYENNQINNGYPYLAWQEDMLSNVPVTKVSLDKETMNLDFDESSNLMVTVYPTYASNREVIWSSDNESVVKVTDSGNVTGVSVGTATITATSVDGGYSDSCVVTVNAKNIEVEIADIADQEYTGSQIKPVVTVTGNGKTLTLDKDYTVEYDDNTNIGSGSVTVKAKTGGNYVFENSVKNFNIVAQAGTVTISGNLNVTYGTVVPDVTVNKNGSDGAVTIYYYTSSACTEGKTATKPTTAGNYWVQAEMSAGTNHGAAVSNILNFTISRANITPEVSITGWIYKGYNGETNAPSVTGNTGNGDVTYKYKLKAAADAAYSTTVPTNAGEYTIKAEITQTANYNAGSATKDFTISPKAIAEAMIADTASQAYTGSEIKPTPVVTDGTVLVNNTDFAYAYENNTYVGTTAKVNVIGKGNYTGTASKTFSITAVNQTPAITGTASVTNGGNTVDLKPLVVNAKGTVSFTINGEANGCTLDNGVLTSGNSTGTVKINVSITAKNEGGDAANEYNAYSQAEAITVTVNDKETQAILNITSATNVTYGQTLALTSEGGSGTGAVTYAVTNGTGEATIAGNVLTPTKVGTVTVIATKAEDATYNSISSAPVIITIDKIKVAIPAVDTTVYTYTGTEQTYQIADNAAYTVAGNKQTAANETGYPITVTLNDTTTHAWTDDTIEVKNYTFIINKATITISAKNKSAYIGDTAPVLGTSDYTVTGLVNSESLKTLPTIDYLAAPDMTQAGTATIKVSGAEAPDGGNYNDIVYNDGTLTISRRSSGGGGGGGVSSYTVKFDANGGSTVKSQSVSKNKTVTEPTAPTKDGYTFDGWYTDKNLTLGYDFDTKVTKSFTLYAKWTENKTEEKPDETDRTETPDTEVIPFTDVDTDDWYYETVKTAYEKGLMKGISDTKFGADTNVTRGMFVTVLYRMEGEPAVNKSIPFADVNAEDYYSNAISWAEQNNIVAGISDTKFAPNDNITREQMATILFRYATYKGMDTVTLAENLDQFTDNSEISEYAISALNWAVGSNVMSGKGNGILDPKGFATRAEAAAVLVRMVK